MNPESAWIRTEVPHLRIVDDTLWQAVRERQHSIFALFGPNLANTREGRTKRLRLTNRPVTLLSGLLVCGCCGGRISMVMTAKRGEVHAELRGELMGILAFATDQKANRSVRIMPPVASCAKLR